MRNIWDEHRNVFRNPTRHARLQLANHPYRRASPKPIYRVWTHNFLCLSSRFHNQVPGLQEKENLRVAGLGEQRVQIGVQATALQLHEKLLMVFPKLKEAGGYELLRCLPNSRTLVQISPPAGGHNPQTLKRNIGQARIYIRPVQKDLPTATIDLVEESVS